MLPATCATFRPARLSRASARQIWTSSTFLASTAHALLAAVQQQAPPSAPGGAQVYAISKNVPYALVDLLHAALLSPGTPSIGALSELLPPALTRKLAPSLSSDAEKVYSLSLARWTPSGRGRAIAWRSSLVGRRGVSVGREIPSGPRADDRGLEESEAGFEAFMSGRKWGFGDRGAGEGGIAELEGVRAEDVAQLVLFGADRTQPVLNALSTYTRSSTIGLIGSSTPFHSPIQAPFSLFLNGELASSGAVGLAIIGEEAEKPLRVDYAGLEALGEPVEVTDAKGNIVLTLNGQNAARTLLNLVQSMPSTISVQGKSASERGEAKEREFYAAVFPSPPSEPLNLTEARFVARIMAGDPSRGAMSVETEEDVRPGAHLVFLTRADSPRPSRLVEGEGATLAFVSRLPSYSSPQFVQETLEEGEVVVVVEGKFVAASENGLVVSRQGGGCWVCGVDGAVAGLE